MTTAIEKAEPSLFQLGRAFAKSGYFTDAREAAQAIVKIAAGRELGFGAFASMNGIHLVKGKLVLSAHLMAAAIRRHDRYDYRVVEHSEQKCAVEFSMDGKPLGVSTFTMDDAQRANLVKADSNWKHWPRNMLYCRALSNGCKWYCPDVFSGPVYTPDEMGLAVDGETLQIIDGQEVIEVGERTRPNAKPVEVKVYAAEPEAASTPAAATQPSVHAPATDAVNSPASAAPSTPAPEPAPLTGLAKLKFLIERHVIGDDRIALWLSHFNVKTLDELADEQCDRICAKVEEKLAELQPKGA